VVCRIRQKGEKDRPRFSGGKVWITDESSLEVGVREWVIYLRDLRAVLREKATSFQYVSPIPGVVLAQVDDSCTPDVDSFQDKVCAEWLRGRRIKQKLSNYILDLSCCISRYSCQPTVPC